MMTRILLVDDDPDVIEATRMVLEKQGYEVAVGYSRQEGLDAIAKQEPDLLLLDVMMEQPDDGIAMAQQLRRSGFTKPILMLSSIGKVTDMEFGKVDDILPVNAFIDKPVQPDVLVAQVKKLLG
ncbi:MAG: response regulator [Phycisphaerae bacterium]|nr:response regulator [Phycisphaerae bacterium]